MKKIIFIYLILFPNKGLIGSVNNNPFEYFSLSIELLKNVNNNDLHYFYQSQNGLNTSITTPFYWGNIQASVQILPFFGLEKDYIDFIGIHQNIKCGKSIHIFEKLRWYNAIGTGYYIFYFSKPLYLSDEIFNPGIAESELSMGFLSPEVQLMDLPSCPACNQSVLDDDATHCPFCGASMSGDGTTVSVPERPTTASASPAPSSRLYLVGVRPSRAITTR